MLQKLTPNYTFAAVPVMILSGMALHAAPAIAAEGEITLRQRDGESIVEVIIDGDLFTAYHYADEYKKPFFWPVRAEGGVGLTRDWPMGDAVVTKDHPHQKSLWTAYGDINGVDLWAEGGNSGVQHSSEVTWGSDGNQGWILANNVWEDKDRKPLVDETRNYRFYATPASRRYFDVVVTFTAKYGEVKFGDTKEGGLVSVRMADGLRETGGTGHVTTAAGHDGAREGWGKPAAWCDYSGVVEGVGTRGLAIFDHPSNLRHPTSWHVRDYGLMGANCFGYSHFTGGKENGDYVLPDGETLTFRYRVYIHSGTAEEADVEGMYKNFASLPADTWKE